MSNTVNLFELTLHETTRAVNLPAFQQFIDHISVHPEEFSMDMWIMGVDEVGNPLFKPTSKELNICKTVGCFAGTVCRLNIPNLKPYFKKHETLNRYEEVFDPRSYVFTLADGSTINVEWSEVPGYEGYPYSAAARNILGLTEDQAESLFYVCGWPKEFSEFYDYKNNPAEENVQVTIERIIYFLTTGE
ncbi:hypothetical protein K9N68_37545 (plasmid) [Kovacikia minuta CCNUW1]|uniref:hypothetical protein n=1 Tax=Kovacikia minuta TaxID=2931930 RepID=UPI001CCB796D|nr:hypothetical protein [Kovacikia minuta]UBF29918.1 hypothetical protein K9N68_37545 [Kovacikia minuta CCNUW1]